MFPSSHSKKAPPAFEIYEKLSSELVKLIAETVSPPPARIDMSNNFAFFFIRLPISIEDLSNGLFSNAPNGPFYKTILDFKIYSDINFIVFFPTSKAIWLEGIFSTSHS